MKYNETELINFFLDLNIEKFSSKFLENNSSNTVEEHRIFFRNNNINLINAENINDLGVKYLFYYLPKKIFFQKKVARPSKWVYLKKFGQSNKISAAEEYITDLSINWRAEKINGIAIRFDYQIKKSMDSFDCENLVSEFPEIRKYTGINKFPENIFVFDDYKSLQNAGFVKPDIFKNSVAALCPNDPELLVKFNLQDCGLPEFLIDGIAGYYNNYISKFPQNNFKFDKSEIKIYIKNLKTLRCSFNPRRAMDSENYYLQKYMLLFNLTISKVKITSDDCWKVYPISFVKFLIEKFGIDKIAELIKIKEAKISKRLSSVFKIYTFFLYWQWRKYLKN